MRTESRLVWAMLGSILVGGGCAERPDSAGDVTSRAQALTAQTDAADAASDVALSCTSTGVPAIAPDKDDYFPPTTVYLNATGLACGASYSVQLTTPNELWPQHVPSTIVNLPAQTADSTGSLTFTYGLQTDVNGNFEVALLDASGNVVATTIFHDSHFRFGHISWTQQGGASARTAAFTVNAAWRRSYPWTCFSSGCNPSAIKVGDIIGNGGATFSFGDGSSIPLYFVVDSIDTAADWLIGRGLAGPSVTASQTITHTYPGVGPYNANVDGCCRLGGIVNDSVVDSNGSGGNYHFDTTVRFDVTDSSPVSSETPIVNAPVNAADFHFQLPVVDADGDVISCQFASCQEEFDLATCVPPAGVPAGMTIDSSTCTVHWNTIGKTIGQLYTTQIHINGTRNGTHIDDTSVDFILEIVQAETNQPQCALDQLSPAATTSTASTAAWTIFPGNTLSFRVTGSDADTTATLELNSTGVPPGALMSPALPTSGLSPQQSSFSWTPTLGDVGSSASVVYAVTDEVGQQAQCSVTIQVGTPCPEGTACDDGNPCTTGDTCHANACVGTPVVCTASDQCHQAGTCNPASGVCSNPLVNDGTACNDGNACTQTDTCQAGVCTGSNPVTCTASDQCHLAGSCNPATGVCSNPSATDGTACNDGNACTQSDSCQSGVCTGANPVVCNASDQCHLAGTCNPATGVCTNPTASNGTACNDGNACTQTDTCQSGVCAGSNPVVCTASDQCHLAGTCDPSSGVCSNPAAANGTTCNDGNACTQTDVCQAGACTGTNPVVCGASDQCHLAGTCNPASGVCSNPAAANGTTCSDGNACTQTDACQAGVCVGTNPVICGASDQCHVAGICDPASGICSNPPAANGTGCNDGNACTQTDTCQAGVCAGSNPVVCSASDQCHVAGTCDPSSGTCSNPSAVDGTTCNDGNACTQTDTCQSGSCIGANPIVCGAEDACHLAGSCDSSTGICSNPIAPPQLNPGANQTVVGSCSTSAVTYTYPTVASSCSATVTCTSIPGNSYGAHAVTCTATDSAGTSAPVSFTVTVLQPLTMQIQPPLYGDNDSVDNVDQEGSTVPVKVELLACGTNVTTTAAVTAKIGVSYVPNGGAPGQNPVPTFNGAGDTGGVMVLDGPFFHYNLSTKGYAVTAGSNPAFYQLNLTVAYQSAPSVVVGTDSIQVDTK